MERKLWKITYLEYSGWDCTGHMISGLYWGTWWEAARECVKNDEDVRPHSYRSVKEFVMPDLKKKKKPFYII
jgi:hypothetical protein